MNFKRLAAAGVVATTLAGGAFAFANSLDVNSQTLASGTDPVQSGCTSVAVNWTTAYDGTGSDANRYVLDTVVLDGLANCAGKSFKVVIAKTNGSSIKEYTSSDIVVAPSTARGNLDNNGDATITALADGIDAADVANVTAVVTGATSTPTPAP